MWEKIIAMGWTGIRIPEEYDGLGLGHLELCVVAEELGREFFELRGRTLPPYLSADEAIEQAVAERKARVALLEREDRMDAEPAWRERGCDAFFETSYLLRRRQ